MTQTFKLPPLPEFPKPPRPLSTNEIIDKIAPKGALAKPMAWAFGFADDLLDYTPIGELPIIGDFLDANAMFWTERAYPASGAAGTELIEFLPFGDILPTFAGSLFMAEKDEQYGE